MKINQKLDVVIDIIESDEEKVVFQILEQNPFWTNKTTYKNKTVFKPSVSNINKYCQIESVNGPQILENENIFYIRGAESFFDNDVLACSPTFYEKIMRTLEHLAENNLRNIKIY